ncbi:Subunit of the glycosylphosphatidylinositol transamidase complex-like protein [Ascosphaera pollenicola]|nr:Subunit of the glycosylphosphatidylinositol transamidase complex-like protein [Ascosphaera pollenicola]
MALYAGLSGELVRGLITHGLGVLASAVVRAILLWTYWRVMEMRSYLMKYIISRNAQLNLNFTKSRSTRGIESSAPVPTAPFSLSSSLKSLVRRTKDLSNNLSQRVPRFANSTLTVLGLGGITKTPKEVLSDSVFVPTPVPPCNDASHQHIGDCVNEELAELVHDYVPDDAVDWRSLYSTIGCAIEQAIALDKKHGFSNKFLSSLEAFDKKYSAANKARALDDKYSVSRQATSGFNSLHSYFEKALDTPTGRKLRDFYQKTEKNVLDIHSEAKRLQKEKKEKEAAAAAAAANAAGNAPAAEVQPQAEKTGAAAEAQTHVKEQ